MKNSFWLAVVLSASCLQPVTAGAIIQAELQDTIARGERITLIDIRNSRLYQDNHIPGAINVPVAVVSVKRLPPLGHVVVYGDGIRTDQTLEAVTALNSKNGIHAEMLEGGLGAWQSLKLQTTRKAGLSTAGLQYLNYQELKKASTANSDMVLIDLRTGERQPLTDLSAEFPLQEVKKLSHGQNGWELSPCFEDGVRDKLFILVDDGKEQSERVARQLTAKGVKRVAILTGGEISLTNKGVAEKKTMVTTRQQP